MRNARGFSLELKHQLAEEFMSGECSAQLCRKHKTCSGLFTTGRTCTAGAGSTTSPPRWVPQKTTLKSWSGWWRPGEVPAHV
jgi:hypothetical protein